VPLEARRVFGARARAGIVVGIDHVLTRADPTEQIGMGRLDAGVEQGNRYATAVEAREVDVRLHARAGSEAPVLDHLRRERGRIGDPDRVDARDLW